MKMSSIQLNFTIHTLQSRFDALTLVSSKLTFSSLTMSSSNRDNIGKKTCKFLIDLCIAKWSVPTSYIYNTVHMVILADIIMTTILKSAKITALYMYYNYYGDKISA